MSLVATAEHVEPIVKENWSFSGPFGTFNRDELQRGFQVYKEVCSTCHSLKHLNYRNLSSLGFSQQEVKAIASNYEVTDGPNDDGQMFQRKAVPSDAFVDPFPNEKAARAANNGSFPPDLSLITKARAGGPGYVYALLTGFRPAPPGIKLGDNMHYNIVFPGNQIAMTPPLTEGQVTYADGTPSSVEQMSRDVVAFLSWAAEPEMEERKQLGVRVLFYLAIMTLVFYLAKRKIWQNIH
jgi:ubiquinol-cytochrome c reductase cytochrome c1 subunit